MKKLLLTIAAIPLAAVSVSASAQTNANAGGGVGIQNRIANLEARYNAGLNAGAFSSAERATISRQLADLRRLEQSYSYNGLTQAERQTLQQRIRTVRDQIRVAGGSQWARNFGWSDAELDSYASGYGSPDASYDQYGRQVPNSGVTYDSYGRPVANNGAVYDSYGRPVANNNVLYDRYGRPVANNGVTYDRYGRPVYNNSGYDAYGRQTQSGGYYGQGGPYEPVSRSNGTGNVLGNVLGGVMGGGGVLGSVMGGGGMGGILGSILSRGGLRTGDVVTSTIGNVLGRANNFGPQYQDNSNVYYRSDGERVYAIDTRTNQVVQVYSAQR